MTLEELEIVVKANVEQATKQLTKLKAQMKDIEGEDGVQKNFEGISDASDDVSKSLTKTKKDFDLLESAGSGALESLLKKLKYTKAESGEVATALSEMGTALGSVLAVVGAVAIAVVLVIARVKMLIAEYKIVWKLIKWYLTPALKVFQGLLSAVGNLIKNQVSQAFVTLKQKLNDGINNLVQVDSKLNQSLSSLKSNLTETGNALATAFSPIIQAVIPLMNNLLAVITNLANGLAQITASLFGGATKIKKATKVNEDYAQSVASINNQLAKFDELNVINNNNGGGASPWEMFTEEDIDSEILKWTDRLKELWENDDIEGLKEFGNEIGKKVGEEIDKLPANEWGKKIGTILNKAITLVNGFLEEQPFKDIGTKIADFILGFIDSKDGLDPETVGELIGNIIMTGIGMVGSFVARMSEKDESGESGWTRLGKWFGKMIRTALDTIDYTELGRTIDGLMQGLLDMALGFFDEAKIEEITEDVKEICEQIHWAEIIEKVLELLWIGWNLTESVRHALIYSIVSDVYKSIHESANPLVQLLLGKVFWIVDSIGASILSLRDTADSLVGDLKIIFNGLIEFFDGVFSGNWNRIWSGLETITIGVFEGMTDGVIGVVNVFVNIINKGIESVERTVNSIIRQLNSIPGMDLGIELLDLPEITPLQTTSQIARSKAIQSNISSGSVSAHKNNQGAKHVALAKGGVLNSPTLALMGEYPGASSNPEIVAPQNILLETSERANLPVMNSIEEMGDKLVTALNSLGVYAEFDYSKLKVGIDNENYRVGGKLYGI